MIFGPMGRDRSNQGSDHLRSNHRQDRSDGPTNATYGVAYETLAEAMTDKGWAKSVDLANIGKRGCLKLIMRPMQLNAVAANSNR